MQRPQASASADPCFLAAELVVVRRDPRGVVVEHAGLDVAGAGAACPVWGLHGILSGRVSHDDKETRIDVFACQRKLANKPVNVVATGTNVFSPSAS